MATAAIINNRPAVTAFLLPGMVSCFTTTIFIWEALKILLV